MTGLEFSELLRNYVSIAAVIVGGIWAYILFIRNREKFLRADLGHTISDFRLPNDQLLIHVELKVSNVGKVLLPITEIETRVQQLLPIEADLLKKIEDGIPQKPTNEAEIEWPLVAFNVSNYRKHSAEIEPGEVQEFVYDFIIDREVKTIVVYSFIYDQGRVEKRLAWERTSTYSITSL